jgi:hypothetical protein
VYSNGSEKLQGNKQEFLIMEMKVPKEDHLKWLKEQVLYPFHSVPAISYVPEIPRASFLRAYSSR